MKQRIYCVACGAHAFDFNGDVTKEGLKSERVTMPDGSKPLPYTDVVIPCGHKISRPWMDFRIEIVAEPDETVPVCSDCGAADRNHYPECLSGRAGKPL